MKKNKFLACQLKIELITALLFFFILTGCQNKGSEIFDLESSYNIVLEKDVKHDELIAALKKISDSPIDEPISFWNKIVNDESYEKFHRKKAIFQLFKRHIHSGMNLTEFRYKLNQPTWLKPSDIVEVRDIIGAISIGFDEEKEAVFKIMILPELGKNISVVYLKISGKVRENDLREFVFKGVDSVKGMALVDNENEVWIEKKVGDLIIVEILFKEWE